MSHDVDAPAGVPGSATSSSDARRATSALGSNIRLVATGTSSA